MMFEPVYQGLGSVFSPAQNAFANLGLRVVHFDVEVLILDQAK